MRWTGRWRRPSLRRGVGKVSLAAFLVLASSVAHLSDPGTVFTAVRRPASTAAAPDERPVFLTTGDGTPLHASLWVPDQVRGGAPILVWVHGGGWIGGSDLDRPAELRRWSQEGWLVMSVEYELAAPGRPTWDRAGPQVACALGRLGAEAVQLGGDPRRIVLAGASAGGQLAVTVGYRAATGTQDSACALPVPVPRAVIAEYPAVDPVEGYEHGLPRGDARSFKVSYTGGTPAEFPERYRAISGVDAVSRLAPPTLLVEGGADRLVPTAGLDRFVAAARSAGVDVSRVVVPGADHAFDAVEGSPGQGTAHALLSAWARPLVSLTPAAPAPP